MLVDETSGSARFSSTCMRQSDLSTGGLPSPYDCYVRAPPFPDPAYTVADSPPVSLSEDGGNTHCA